MSVYFRGREALITSREFIRFGPPAAVFSIRELLHPHVMVTGPAGPLGRRHSYEVHAIHRSRWVCLFRTTDERLFGQITRALVRALEAQEEYTLRFRKPWSATVTHPCPHGTGRR